MEFQRRGVVHFHILAWVPKTGPEALSGYRWWLWEAWRDVAGDGERLRVDADYARARDMVRYFVAYSSIGRKAYQHVVPLEWRISSGRWWGLRGITVMWKEYRLDRGEFVRVRRTLLRYRRARAERRLPPPRSLTGCWVLGQRSGSLADAIVRVLMEGG
jgi:hypothetical protein